MAKQPRILSGQVVAITGGARGIGKETARALVAQGMKVAIGDLDLATCEATAAELGPNVKAYALNVTDLDSFTTFIDAVEADLGPLDVLVNNAGIMQLGPFLQEDHATAHRQVDINVHGVLYGMKIALPRFVARGRGHLVNIASTAGKGGFPGGATYCGTKHFVVGTSEAVRLELRGTGVEVSCVMPVIVNTELASGLQEARGVKNVTPQDVANEIVDALQVPRFDVFVPRSVGTITTVMNVVPRRGREALVRALKADRVLLSADPEKRRAYELRASQSEPGLEPGDQVKELTK
ncbi:SDR family oxidoreductase [Paraconexibacter antarcticus]|uniref:SDR family oxidoreductase n=1 Tax=Paraconexibacter antarcticus TaxID=2949664 RepID=A0ABY5DVQ0_9ACTN|nr:SDR family oxidoreductase [Paraconexibacter antarcticus]UTI64725.1 SDR family oxidoreductase [Paraconexibacter antarcticus]